MLEDSADGIRIGRIGSAGGSSGGCCVLHDYHGSSELVGEDSRGYCRNLRIRMIRVAPRQIRFLGTPKGM